MLWTGARNARDNHVLACNFAKYSTFWCSRLWPIDRQTRLHVAIVRICAASQLLATQLDRRFANRECACRRSWLLTRSCSSAALVVSTSSRVSSVSDDQLVLRPCIHLSHHSTTAVACGGFAAERHAGGRYRSTDAAPGAHQQRSRSTALSCSKCEQCMTFTADV